METGSNLPILPLRNILSIDPDKYPMFTALRICPKKAGNLIEQVCLTYLNMDHFGQRPPPDDIFDNIWSDLESDGLHDGSAEFDEFSDEDEDSEDQSYDDSVNSHNTSEAAESLAVKAKVTAYSAFMPYFHFCNMRQIIGFLI